MKFGRYSLVSSHAGTRLPIAAYKAQGAPLSSPHTCGIRSPFKEFNFKRMCPGIPRRARSLAT